MSEILRRLLNIARSHLIDVIDSGRFRPRADSRWDSTFSEAGEAYRAHRASGPGPADQDAPGAGPGTASHTDSGLPHSPALARAYALLDLPFGTPMAQVSKRWKTYLKTCHPDRFANDPERQADATELTQALTGAHDTIAAAWQVARKRHDNRTT